MGPQTRTPRYSNDDKNLIAEQPARVVLLSGLFIALIFGLLFRGVTAPNKIKSLIDSAAQRMHKDVQVKFESAHLSLSRGLLPRFAVIVTGVRMESDNECWMAPRMQVDEIRLPLSFWALVNGHSPITRVEAGQVSLNLRKEFKNCEKPVEKNTEATSSIKQFVRLKKTTQSPVTEAPPQVTSVAIDRLRIMAPKMEEPLELNSFAMSLKSMDPRVVEVTARTHLMKDEQVGDYLSHASVWIEYSEFPHKIIQSRLSGNWREGSYQLRANYQFKDEMLDAGMDLKHIPLSQVFSILKKFQWLEEDYNGRQVWVSLNTQMKAHKGDLKKAEAEMKDLLLEGDLGDLRIASVKFASLEPFKYEPFNIDIRRLNLEKLFVLLNRPHPSPIFGQLGVFQGTADIRSQEQIRISGSQSGLEFIFSNRGQREVQRLSEIAGTMSLDRGQWQVNFDRFVPDQGVFNGRLNLTADRDFKTLDIRTNVSEFRLAPAVVRLMASGGELGAMNGDLHMKFSEGAMSYIKGPVQVESFDIDGVKMEKMRMAFDTQKNELLAQTQINHLSLQVGTQAFQMMKDLIETDWMSEGQMSLRNLSTQFRAKSTKEVRWKNFVATVEKSGTRLSSDGEWLENGTLSGEIAAGGGKGGKKWALGGRRDQPVFMLIETGKKKGP